ncbi:unnamed protein product [Gordionus sp. m RMFG-2023]
MLTLTKKICHPNLTSYGDAGETASGLVDQPSIKKKRTSYYGTHCPEILHTFKETTNKHSAHARLRNRKGPRYRKRPLNQARQQPPSLDAMANAITMLTKLKNRNLSVFESYASRTASLARSTMIDADVSSTNDDEEDQRSATSRSRAPATRLHALTSIRSIKSPS